MEIISPVRARAQAENDLMGIEQDRRRNALMDAQARRMDQSAAFDQERFRASQEAAQREQESAVEAQQTEWIKNAIGLARQNPQVIPALVGEAKQRGLLPAEVQTLAPEDIEQLALHYGVAPAAQAPQMQVTDGPFGSQIVQQGGRFQVVEPPKAASEGATSRQLVSRPTADGLMQDFGYNPKTNQREPVGEPYKAEKSSADSRLSVTLRKEFEGLGPVKNYMTVLPLYQRAATAPNTRAGDVSVVYALGKMFDPTSVVREGELRLSQNAAPWLVKVANEANSQIRGKGAISQETRRQIVEALKGQVDSLKLGYQRERERFAGYAPSYGVDPNEIVGDDPAEAYSTTPKTKRAPPKPGQVVRGYRFKGGDPASPDSWAKAGK